MPRDQRILFSRRIRQTGSLYRFVRNNAGEDAALSQVEDTNIPPIAQTISPPPECMEEQNANDETTECANDSDDDYGLGFREEIRSFALDANLAHIHCNRLLGILRKYTSENFPKDSRTFLETYRDKANRTISNIQGGQFWYQGIRACFAFELGNIKPPTVDMVHINVSVDGLPLHDSGPAQFWPILIDIFEMPEAPVMTVGLFCGDSKPANLEEYLRPFVDDINEVQENGITIGGKPVQLRLRAIIADSPARAFIKGVAYFNAKQGCLKCTGLGVYHKVLRKVIFPSSAGPKRTDNAFRAGSYGEHHRSRTPLLDIRNIDIIEDVIIADRLHLMDHGVTKRLLTGWCEGGLGAQHRWTSAQKETISKKLLQIKFPNEMNAPMRSLNSLSSWKGTEFRRFLHYASLGILRESLDQEAFDHFMLYFCAITLLSSNAFREHWRLAGTLLEKFVDQFGSIYGAGHISSNVHQLLHVYDDVAKFGNLETMSSYRFESFMQQLNRMLRSGYKNIQQVVNRTAEKAAFEFVRARLRAKYPKVKEIGNQTVLFVRQGFSLRQGMRNEWFLTSDSSIVQYQGIVEEAGSIRILGRRLNKKAVMFQTPVGSEIMHLYVGKLEDLSVSVFRIPLSHVKCKLVALERSEDCIDFAPLLHTLVE